MSDVYRLIAWMHIHKKIILLSTFVIFIAAVAVLATIPIQTWKNILHPPRHPLRNIVETTNFEELWMSNNISVEGATGWGGRGFLQVESNYVYSLVVYKTLVGQDWILRKQQLDNGSVQWERKFPSLVRTVQMDDQYLFVITSKQVGCSVLGEPDCEELTVTVYEAGNGEEVWTNTYEGSLNVELAETTDSSIIIHGSGNRGNRRSTYTIDKISGIPSPDTTPQYTLKEIYSQHIDPQSILNNPDFTPTSNVFEQDGVFYFVTEQGQLLALHKESGNIIGSVEFVPNDLFVPPDTITVLGEGDTIVVYFADSRQIFTFHIP